MVGENLLLISTLYLGKSSSTFSSTDEIGPGFSWASEITDDDDFESGVSQDLLAFEEESSMKGMLDIKLPLELSAFNGEPLPMEDLMVDDDDM